MGDLLLENEDERLLSVCLCNGGLVVCRMGVSGGESIVIQWFQPVMVTSDNEMSSSPAVECRDSEIATV